MGTVEGQSDATDWYRAAEVRPELAPREYLVATRKGDVVIAVWRRCWYRPWSFGWCVNGRDMPPNYIMAWRNKPQAPRWMRTS